MFLFADNITLYRSILSDADHYYNCILQSNVSAIVSWINSSLLSLQPAKCCYMFISRKRNSKISLPCITVDGAPLALVSFVGINYSDLSWSPHVAQQSQETYWPPLSPVWQVCRLSHSPPTSQIFHSAWFRILFNCLRSLPHWWYWKSAEIRSLGLSQKLILQSWWPLLPEQHSCSCTKIITC